jgi:mono/diheme cytochrome c family protein
LTTKDGQPFLGDGLARYGYLPNPASDAHLPIGFVASGPQGSETLGMSCAACHTRNIEVGGQAYRVDGGPALSDFGALLIDLRDAVGKAKGTPAFTTAVLGANATPAQVAALNQAVDLWHLRQDTLFSHAIPSGGWGVGRLDAVSMIFDRLTGLDIGTTPDRIIAANIYPADAPVRYPFVWNAPRQDTTQWPGFAPNGDDFWGLVRNLGEVYGVFAEFAPKKDPNDLLKVNFLAGNSANFNGLARLESLIRQIGPPKWPFLVDADAARRGAQVFALTTGAGGCAECHEAGPGVPRASLTPTWKTPIQDTGTDTRELDVLRRTASTGVLAGTGLPLDRFAATDSQFNILIGSVTGSIAQHETPFGAAPATGFVAKDALAVQQLFPALPPPQQGLLQAFQLKLPPKSAAAPGYESRRLYGIWAAAPYLHNGSVPTLADLLKPAAERPSSFAVGRVYDIGKVGLAAVQPGWMATRVTTGCEDRNSGNSRCGHEFGTTLTPAQKSDLLEFLKTL